MSITVEAPVRTQMFSELDGRHAAEILEEIYSGHPAAADKLAEEYSLGNLSEDQLEHLAGFFGIPLI
jgi:hypothetical protein